MTNRKEIRDYKPIILGIDHGYGNMKTAHTVFRTGVDVSDDRPIVSRDYVHYQDKYYVIGETAMTYQGEKTQTEDFYILTLAAMAKELQYRGFSDANVILAVGLPLAWVSVQAASFRKYLMRDQDVEFEYQDKPYHIHIQDVYVLAQGFAAACTGIPLDRENMVADIGNGTMNVLRIVDGQPIETSLSTEKYGVSICRQKIQNEMRKRCGQDLPESLVERLLRDGCAEDAAESLQKAARIAERYAEEIVRRLKSYGYSEGLMRLYVIGGGGCLLKNYTKLAEVPNVVFIDDICANAVGYEALVLQRMKMSERKRK